MNVDEYIKFHHRNYMKVISDETEIILFPKKKANNKSIVVKVTNAKSEYCKTMSIEDYEKIKIFLLSLNQSDIEIPKVINYTDGTQALVGITDCGINTILIKNDTIKKEFRTCGVIRDYHGKFFDVTQLILKASKLEMKDIN